jgi:hypothetical protein
MSPRSWLQTRIFLLALMWAHTPWTSLRPSQYALLAKLGKDRPEGNAISDRDQHFAIDSLTVGVRSLVLG